MKLHLDNNIAEGTPEELVKYQELLEEKEKEAELLKPGHMHQLTETEQRAINNFKGLLGSLKIPDSYTTSTESSTDEAGEDKLLGYRYWYLDGTNFNKFVVLEVSLEGYFEDSTGKRYTYQAVSGYVKPVDNEYVCKAFERARGKRALLSYYPVVDEFQTSY